MPEGFDKKTTLWMRSEDYEAIEAKAKELARKPSELLRAAIVLGMEAIEKGGDKAVRRGLGVESDARKTASEADRS